MTRFWKVAVFASAVCSGCSIGPRYQRPIAPTPAALKEMGANSQWKMATPSDALIKGKWWEIFGDPKLNELEELVNVNNQNVKLAEARFREARTLVLANRAAYYPEIGTSPSITAGRNGNSRSISHSFSVGGSVAWEPDLWGRVRLSVENAVNNAQVSAADLENIRLSQQALLATDYFLLAAQDMQLAILVDTISSYEKNLQLTVNRHAGGVASRSDITLAQTQLSNAKAQYTETRVSRSQYEHAIAVLTGQVPSALEIGLSRIAGPPPSIPIGVPSQLLERRPDIAASERQVAAANADVGLARTAYYPTLTLSASLGVLSSGIVNLFTYASRSWSTGASLDQTLFDFGRRGANLANAEAAYDATVASYRQTVLAAFQEVEDDLSNLRYLTEEAGHQQEAVAQAQESLALETERYRAGTDSYLNVITTQILTLNAQEGAINILQRRMTAAVDLVKALGGGWDASTLPSADVIRSAELANPRTTENVARTANQ